MTESDLESEPEPGAAWDPVPKAATKAKSYSKRGRQLADPERKELEIVTVRPRKSDIDVRLVTLAWDPRQE